MSRRSFFLALTAAFAVTACGGGGSQQAAAPPAPTSTATPAPAPTGVSEFGVPECDDYLNKYVACIDSKVPEAMRVVIRQSLDETKAQWKQVASTPEGKTGLAAACKAASEATKSAMSAYGCTF